MCEQCGTKHAGFGDREERVKRWCGKCAKAMGMGAINLAAQLCTECGLKHAGYGMLDDRKKLWCGPCGKPKGAVLLHATKKCEDCSEACASFGIKEENKVRWCNRCATLHGAVLLAVGPRLCQDCSDKFPTFGFVSDRKKRWCGDCGKKHNAVNLRATLCEACGQGRAIFGHHSEPKRKRWCQACGEARNAVPLYGRRKMCEDCDSKRPHFGTSEERRPRWCAGCGKKHNAIRVDAMKLCEMCGELQPSYGMAVDRKRRWCKSCGGEKGAIFLGNVGADKNKEANSWHGAAVGTLSTPRITIQDPGALLPRVDAASATTTIQPAVLTNPPGPPPVGQPAEARSLPPASASGVLHAPALRPQLLPRPLIPVPQGYPPSMGCGATAVATAAAPAQKRQAIEAVASRPAGARVALGGGAGRPTSAPAISATPALATELPLASMAPTFLGI